MKSKKTVRKALWMSMLSIALCLTMLVGTTFAWFTDTATTSVNKITAGNLHVEIQDKNNEKITNLQWVNKEGVAFNQDDLLWEPGCTYLLTPFKIVNTGNLALKYKIVITGLDGDAKLLKVIKFTYTTEDGTFDMDAEGHLAANGGATKMITVSAHMDEAAGNEYQNEKLEGVEFKVYATQDTVENDSYGPEYDKTAQYPDAAYVTVAAPTEDDIANGVNPLANALIAASTETGAGDKAKQEIYADLSEGTFKMTDKEGEVRNAVKGKEVTLNGAGAENTTYEVKKAGATGEGAADYSFDGAKAVVFKNMTIEFGLNTDYQGFVRAGAARFENCTIKGMGANWGVGDVVFDNCNFVFPEGGNEWTYNLWTYGGSSFTFNNCTFTSDIGKFINVYRQGNDGVVDVTLNQCKFINNANSANKAAVKINGDHVWNVTINECTTDGEFPADNGGLWQIENAVAGNKVTVDGTVAFSK